MTGRNGINLFIARAYNVQMPHVYRTEAERKRNGNSKNHGTAVQRKQNGIFCPLLYIHKLTNLCAIQASKNNMVHIILYTVSNSVNILVQINVYLLIIWFSD